jgi:hypothetical protein
MEIFDFRFETAERAGFEKPGPTIPADLEKLFHRRKRRREEDFRFSIFDFRFENAENGRGEGVAAWR